MLLVRAAVSHVCVLVVIAPPTKILLLQVWRFEANWIAILPLLHDLCPEKAYLWTFRSNSFLFWPLFQEMSLWWKTTWCSTREWASGARDACWRRYCRIRRHRTPPEPFFNSQQWCVRNSKPRNPNTTAILRPVHTEQQLRAENTCPISTLPQTGVCDCLWLNDVENLNYAHSWKKNNKYALGVNRPLGVSYLQSANNPALLRREVHNLLETATAGSSAVPRRLSCCWMVTAVQVDPG